MAIEIGTSHTNPNQPENTSAAMSTADQLAQLEKLGQLREQGLLTDEEFQQQKKKILDA